MTDEKKGTPEAATSEALENERLPARLERYAEQKEKSISICECLPYEIEKYTGKDLVSLVKAWDALEGCGNWLKFHNYYTIDEIRLVEANFCKKALLCPLCALRRSAKAVRELESIVKAIQAQNEGLKFSMMTLTIKNRESLQDAKDHIDQSFKRLSQRRRNDRKGNLKTPSEFGKVEGAVFSYENKRGKNSGKWHVHVHGAVLHYQDFSTDALSDEWLRCTGDSYVVDVRPMHNPEDPARDLCEVCSYALKFSNLSMADLVEAFLLFTGSRLLRKFGLLRGFKVPEELTDEVEDLPYIELVYRFSRSRGYSLDLTPPVSGSGHIVKVSPSSAPGGSARVDI